LETAKLSKDKRQILKAKAFLDQRRRAILDLILPKAREEYFEAANKLRTEGKSTDNVRARPGIVAIITSPIYRTRSYTE
jgi:hypothetical protein